MYENNIKLKIHHVKCLLNVLEPSFKAGSLHKIGKFFSVIKYLLIKFQVIAGFLPPFPANLQW